MKTVFHSVENYISAQPEAVQPILESIRSTILEALPEAEEGIAYGMPVYRLRGEILICFAGWKKHYSLYPISAATIAAIATPGEELTPYEFNGRGTLRLRFDRPVPVEAIQRIVRVRMASLLKPR